MAEYPPPAGPPGPAGPAGPPGPQAYAFVWDQAVASATWIVVHNLGGYPNVTVVDSAGSVVEGDEHYDSANQITLSFSAPFSGHAYLS